MYVPGLRIWAVSCKMTRPEVEQMKYFAVKKTWAIMIDNKMREGLFLLFSPVATVASV